MSEQSLQIIDERRLRVPRGALSNADTEQIGKTITHAAQDGYSLVNLTQILGGMRGDTMTAIELTFRKSS